MKVLVTGGTNGMGKGVAKVLAARDNPAHEVIILCRSKERGEAVLREIESASSNSKVSMVLCDLAKLSDVKNAITEIQNSHEYLDGIFINAGLGYAAKRVETEDKMDSHFQVNYLSQFMLVLNLVNLLEKSTAGGRVIFNATEGGKISWDDMQMAGKWGYEKAIHQAMAAKRMFLSKLHGLYKSKNSPELTFVGFQIPKTVWSNQIAIIPPFMRAMATGMKFLGAFISIDECGEIMAPLFTESREQSLKKSGKFITMKNGSFIELNEDADVMNREMQDRLWKISLELCADEKTVQISELLHKKG